MNKNFRSSIGRLLMLSIALTLTACGGDDPGRQGLQADRLPPCSAEGSVFKEKAYKDWKDTYHAAMSKAVEEHLKTLDSTTELPLRCTEADYENLVPASDALKEMAQMVPLWKNNPEALDKLSEADLAPVMLEFLRVYECSMRERQMYLAIYILDEAAKEDKTNISLGDFTERQAEQEAEMAKELTVARATLNRTLALIGGYDRLRPLALDIECIKRASLDLRNVLGLASDAAACLPRAWDTHGSLRDLPEK